MRLYCPVTCGTCPETEVNFALTQASTLPPSARLLSEQASEQAVAPPALSPADEQRQIRAKCAPQGEVDLLCVQGEVLRRLRSLHVAKGSLKMSASGSLTAGDWQVSVDLVAQEQCALAVQRVRPTANLVISILDQLGIRILYAVPPTCRTSEREHLADLTADVAQQKWSDLTADYEPRASALCTRTVGTSDSDGLAPATIALLVTTVVGWLLAATLGMALVSRGKLARASVPRDVVGASTTVEKVSSCA